MSKLKSKRKGKQKQRILKTKISDDSSLILRKRMLDRTQSRLVVEEKLAQHFGDDSSFSSRRNILRLLVGLLMILLM